MHERNLGYRYFVLFSFIFFCSGAAGSQNKLKGPKGKALAEPEYAIFVIKNSIHKLGDRLLIHLNQVSDKNSIKLNNKIVLPSDLLMTIVGHVIKKKCYPNKPKNFFSKQLKNSIFLNLQRVQYVTQKGKGEEIIYYLSFLYADNKKENKKNRLYVMAIPKLQYPVPEWKGNSKKSKSILKQYYNPIQITYAYTIMHALWKLNLCQGKKCELVFPSYYNLVVNEKKNKVNKKPDLVTLKFKKGKFRMGGPSKEGTIIVYSKKKRDKYKVQIKSKKKDFLPHKKRQSWWPEKVNFSIKNKPVTPLALTSLYSNKQDNEVMKQGVYNPTPRSSQKMNLFGNNLPIVEEQKNSPASPALPSSPQLNHEKKTPPQENENVSTLPALPLSPQLNHEKKTPSPEENENVSTLPALPLSPQLNHEKKTPSPEENENVSTLPALPLSPQLNHEKKTPPPQENENVSTLPAFSPKQQLNSYEDNSPITNKDRILPTTIPNAPPPAFTFNPIVPLPAYTQTVSVKSQLATYKNQNNAMMPQPTAPLEPSQESINLDTKNLPSPVEVIPPVKDQKSVPNDQSLIIPVNVLVPQLKKSESKKIVSNDSTQPKPKDYEDPISNIPQSLLPIKNIKSKKVSQHNDNHDIMPSNNITEADSLPSSPKNLSEKTKSAVLKIPMYSGKLIYNGMLPQNNQQTPSIITTTGIFGLLVFAFAKIKMGFGKQLNEKGDQEFPALAVMQAIVEVDSSGLNQKDTSGLSQHNPASLGSFK